MKILLIWEEIPERTRFFLIDSEKFPLGERDLSETLEDLQLIHKQYVNTGINVPEALMENSAEYEGFVATVEQSLNTWSNLIVAIDNKESDPEWMKELSFGEVVDCTPDKIFHSGFAL